jgi:hypothetical protein
MSDTETIDRPTELTIIDPLSAVPVIVSPRTAFLPVPWEDIEHAAALISSCPGVSPHFADPNNCRFVAYQAARWRMDPVAVALKTYFTPRKGGGLVVGYEAQLVHALVNTNAPIVGPLEFRYGYSDPKRPTIGNRFCEVIGMLKGASAPSRVVTPTVGQIKTKNSPSWFSNPDSQLSYFAVRDWARRFCPEVIMGVYTRDEVREFADVEHGRSSRSLFEEDDAPEADGSDLPDIGGSQQSAQAPQDRQEGPQPPPAGNVQPDDLPALRDWLAGEQRRILALTGGPDVSAAWTALLRDDRIGRIKAYDQAVFNAVKASVTAHIAKLRG